MLTTVTFTGADDSIAPDELCYLSELYPFVEWGILFSQRHQGSYRYPSAAWIERLSKIKPLRMKLSAHLCGWWVRDIVQHGNFGWHRAHEYADMFDRIQLNFHAERMRGASGLDVVLNAGAWHKPFILQCDNVNDSLARDMALHWPGAVQPLFDTSGGAGVLPQSWPSPWPSTVCGYAGGLGPSTIVPELTKIAAVTGDSEYWIDMERRVRSADDTKFELMKVQDVLHTIVNNFPDQLKWML